MEAVTDLSTAKVGQQGGTLDAGWKAKHHNSMKTIKNAESLNMALTYLIEEQHSILETYQGDLESVLVNAHE